MRWAGMVGASGRSASACSRCPVPGRRFWQFVLESRIELRKVVWPTRQETMHDDAVVFGFVVIAGLFFWVLDLLLGMGDAAI